MLRIILAWVGLSCLFVAFAEELHSVSVALNKNHMCEGYGSEEVVQIVTDLFQMAMPGSSSTTFMSVIRSSLNFSATDLKKLSPAQRPQHWEIESGQTCRIQGNCADEIPGFLCHGDFRFISQHVHATTQRVPRFYKAPDGYSAGDLHVLTFLRHPYSYAAKVFSMFKSWDPHYFEILGETGREVSEVTIEEWLEKAYWRWNIFNTMFVGRSLQLIIMKTKDIAFTRDEMIEWNAQGTASDFYQEAVAYLTKPTLYFGIFEEITDSWELFGHTTCVPEQYRTTRKIERPKTGRDLSPEVQQLVQKYHALDLLLYEYGVELFHQRVKQMNQEKAQGYRCMFMGCGLHCDS